MLESLISITGVMSISRGIASGIQKVSEALFPFSKSRDAKRIELTAKHNMELEKVRQQGRLAELGIQAKVNEQLEMTRRETNLIISQMTSNNHIKEELYRDAIRRFPLNISPLSLLENNGIKVDFFIDKYKNDTLTEDERKEFRSYLREVAKPLNIFVLPITIDSRVAGKENIAAQVWDDVYQTIESIFVNEYNIASQHPVNIYSTAWNQNAKPGLHAAEELYFFLKDIPTVVIEPRFDGKKLRIMFSFWSIGYNLGQLLKQEITIDFDWLPIIISNAYNRSKDCLEILSKMGIEDSLLKKKKEYCEHNIRLFENLKIRERILSDTLSELDVLGDYTRWFALDSSDWSIVSEKISHSVGLIMAAISDTHHLLASDVEPMLPQIYGKYFKEILNNDMRNTLFSMYENAYQRLVMFEPYNDDLNQLRELQKWHIRKALFISGLTKDDNPLSILIERCYTRWKYKALTMDDAFKFYITHFSMEDDIFNKYLKVFLDREQVFEMQRRYYELNKK